MRKSKNRLSDKEEDDGLNLAMQIITNIPEGMSIDAVMLALGIVIGLQAELQEFSDMEADAWLLNQQSNILAALKRGEFKAAAEHIRRGHR